MRRLVNSKRSLWEGFCVAGIAVALLGVYLAAWPTEATGQILSDSEMAATFGDAGTDPCVKNMTPCTIQFGDTNQTYCGYCDLPNHVNRVCCDLGNGTACTYTGGASPCNGGWYMESAPFGNLGSCNTCNGRNFAKNGLCNDLINAKGNNCAN